MKTIVLGAGFIGGKISEKFGFALVGEKIRSKEDVERIFEREKPETVINCIGKVGRPNVDWCETHKRETFFSNATVPLWLAEECQKTKAKFVHLGTGCIYEGDNGGKGFSEEDAPNFYGSFYSRTKAMIEELLKEYENVLQLRLRMPIDSIPSERNLITKLANNKKQISVPNSMTVVDDFLYALEKLLEKNCTGVYNVVNPEPITHRQIIEMYQKVVDKEKKVEYITTQELDQMLPAKRSNCVLSTKKLESEGIQLRHTLEAVEDCMKKYKEAMK
ncbi:MAG: sugar nucleotide-binding protein [Candidatus Diapherotrites archaeon]